MGHCLRSLIVVVSSFMIASGLSSALVMEEYGCDGTSTVQTAPVALNTGDIGSSSISSTGDYGEVTIGAGLEFYETADATVSAYAAPALDGSGMVADTSDSGTVSGLSTSNADDLIYVAALIRGVATVTSVTNSGTALTWTQRGAVSDGTNERVETWWAVAPTASSRDITVSFSATTIFIVIAFGISGANTTDPFDPDLGSPVTGTGSGTTQSVTLSTVNPNDFLIGAVAVRVPSGTAPNPSAGTGFTTIYSTDRSTLGGAAEYKRVMSPQTSATVDFSTASSVTWAMIGDAIQGTIPSASSNTALTAPATSGSFTVSAGYSAFLWSPAYTSAATIYAGTWALDLWAMASSQGSMDVLLLVYSSGTVTDWIVSDSTDPVSTSKSEVITTFAGPETSISSGDRLLAVLTNPTGSGITYTIYWGTGQTTNFDTPSDFDYVLRFVNSGSTSYSVSLSVYSYSSIDRITSMNVSLYSPATAQVLIADGAVTQSSGSSVTLSGSSTLYVRIQAVADEFGSSSIVLYAAISPGTNPFCYYAIDVTVN
jgi:hypothetical protein